MYTLASKISSTFVLLCLSVFVGQVNSQDLFEEVSLLTLFGDSSGVRYEERNDKSFIPCLDFKAAQSATDV